MNEWQQELRRSLSPPDGRQNRLAVVGVGQTLRGDDGAGALVARQVAARLDDPALLVVAADHAPENCLGVVTRFQPGVVLFVDAARGGGAPGEVVVVPAAAADGLGGSTHTLPLATLGDYLTAVTGAPVFVLGIEPGRMAFGEGVSAPVAAAVAAVTAALVDYWRSAAAASSARVAGAVSVAST